MRPEGCKWLNYEVEIAIVIGRTARNVSPEQAAEHIAGYTIANDYGLHDFRDTDAGSMLRVKGSDTLCPLGPGLSPAGTSAASGHRAVSTPLSRRTPPMRITVDLNKCNDHGQCVFSAPAVFSLDDDGKLTFRRQAAGSYVSGDLDESLRDDVEEAADVCPLQAITVED